MFLFKLPDPGEGLLEAEIANWLVAEGDRVAVNDLIVEVETAKSLVELPSPVDGVVRKLRASVGDTVPVGEVIVEFEVDGDDSDSPEPMLVGRGPSASSSRRRARGQAAPVGATDEEPKVPTEPVEVASEVIEESAGEASEGLAEQTPEPKTAPEEALEEALEESRPVARAKPLVRKLARDLGVQLSQVLGSGPKGIIRREDVEAAAAKNAPSAARPAADEGPDTWTEPIKGVRKATAANVTQSIRSHVQVTEWMDVDVSAAVEFVAALKSRDEFDGVKVSPLLLVAKAACKALRKFPVMNAKWLEDEQLIEYHRSVNLGIAADTPRGLMVPNIKGADELDLKALAVALSDLVEVSRAGKLTPPDYSGGTFTITNLGVFGVEAGTPVINGDETGILCVGAISRRPWVVDAPGGDHIEPRWIVTLSITFDHRLVDGAEGSLFMREVADLLQMPALALLP